MREPDRGQLDIFVDALFRHARQGYVSHRAFIEGTTKVFRITRSALTGGLSFVADVAEDDARRAANNPQPAVFCPPICTFTDDKRAAEKNIAEGLALSVECDDHPAQALAILEDILGPPTVSVLSGGKYVDPDTGEIENKRHLHWRLSIPATGKDLILLKEARKLATQLVNADEANNPICHPMRWPGSWHCKAEPTLCRIEKANSEIEIDLPAALAALKAGSPNSRKAKANGHDKAESEGPDWVVLIKGVLSGDDYHNALTRLAIRLLRSGMHDAAAVNLLRAWMRASAGPRDERWYTRFNDIPRGVSTARAKIGGPQDEDADADDPTELLDPWQRYTAPPFPLKTLPPVLADYVTTQSQVIGCSASALAMATLAAASGALDHRFSLKMMQHGNWLVSPRLWVLLVGDPSTEKTPAINAAINELERFQADKLRKHKELRRQYLAKGGDAGKFEQEHPSPTRYVIHDSTIEKLGIHLAQQDRGILLKKDEVTGWIGAMEKYASGRGSATDRAFWLQAYDGGFYSVDRVKRDDLIINRLSVSMIGGIQPARLAELQGLASDGLLQRFLPVLINSSSFPLDKPVSEEAERYGQLIRRLAAQAPYQLFLSDEACTRMEELRRRLHEIEQAAGGLAEGFQGFVGKLPGVAGNLALILTLVADRVAGEVSVGTIDNVATIIEDFILPHAHEFYAGSAVSEPLQRLTSYILTSGKDRIVPSDLTVNVRDLRGLGLWDLNQKLSLLIAGGWLTPEESGPTARAWTVNSAVHQLFRTRAEEEERRKATMAKLMNSPRKSRREQ